MPRMLIFLCLIAVAMCPARARATQDQSNRIDALMRAANKIGVFNGNVLVRYRGELVYKGSFGYADASKTRDLTAGSRFYVGSIEKEFNGAGVFLLNQQGKLKLDDKVSQYLKGYPSWSDDIQIGQLMNYTSGLPDPPDQSDSSIHDWLMKLPSLAGKPGATYIYSYANVYLQQRIIEQVTGLSYHEFLRSQLLRPCGVLDVQPDLPISSTEIALSFYNDSKPVDLHSSMSPGVMFTTEDLSRWVSCLSANKLLSSSSLDAMAKSFGSGESSLGSAEMKDGKLNRHQHQGSGYNYDALVVSDLDDPVLIVLLTNNQNFKLFQLKDSILAILHGQPYTVPKRSIYLDIREGLATNFAHGMDAYLNLRRTRQDVYDFSNEPLDLISTGKYLMRRQKFDDAIAMFEISTTFPLKPSDRSYAFELIADSWSKKSNNAMAALYYEKALETDPGNKNAKGKIDGLKVQ